MIRVFIALAGAVFVACSGASSGGGTAENDSSRGDEAAAEWVTIEGVDFPAAMAEAPPEILEAYVFAARHPEVLSYMPCFCGCENQAEPHRSNYDCFIHSIDRAGPRPRVEIDPMGFG